ncbi:MAG: hypothetical protein ABIH04_03665 [Planctomycetota bacterium]
MAKHFTTITIIAVFSILWISSAALSVPDAELPFANPQPVYTFDWTFGLGGAGQDINGNWIETGLNPHIGQSAADGLNYSNSAQNYWTSLSGGVNGFSLTNNIGDWLDAIGTGQAAIHYAIREDYGVSVDNSDVINLTAAGVETKVIDGTDDFALAGGDDVTALDWNVDFDDEPLVYNHSGSTTLAGYLAQGYVWRNQHDETVYMTFGATGQVDGAGIQTGTTRANKTWAGATNGYYAGTTYYIDPGDPNGVDEYLLNPTFDGTNWFLPVTVSSTTYAQRMDLPYDGVNYPASSGSAIQWYDDYDLYLAGGGIANPGAYGVSGRYILERDAFLYTGVGTGYAHHADICYEARTYEPLGNADGPTSPYQWLYDASGDMYNPTDGSGLPADTELQRASKLVDAHPYWVNDDSPTGSASPDIEYSTDGLIWRGTATLGSREGVITDGLFVESWKLAGMMLGMEFWSSGYAWDAKTGQVVDLGSSGDVLWDISWYTRLPVWTWNSTSSQWELPTTYNQGDPDIMDRLHIWDWLPNESGTPVAGYDALNNFMKFVFDIDALVVEDVDDDGEFDVGDDYVLFSVVDDGLYNMYNVWGTDIGDDDAFFAGQYFDGDTIFMYDGTSVTTFFDAEAGIFFGQSIDTATGYGTGQTLWSMYNIYDLDALDIGILPEPSTIFLMIGSASGLAVVAGVMRRKMR